MDNDKRPWQLYLSLAIPNKQMKTFHLANTGFILTSEIISLIPHAHFAVCTHGDGPDLSADSERYHVIL